MDIYNLQHFSYLQSNFGDVIPWKNNVFLCSMHSTFNGVLYTNKVLRNVKNSLTVDHVVIFSAWILKR